MSRIQKYVIKALAYLAIAFAGVWVSNLLLGIDFNPFTKALPCIIALGILIFTIKEELK